MNKQQILTCIFFLLLLLLLWMHISKSKTQSRHIVIGAGPVGFWTAALLALHQQNVVIFEKRREYTRTQPIRIWPGFYPIFYGDKGQKLCQIFQNLENPYSICKLEKGLKTWILENVPEYVTFRYSECKNLEDLDNHLDHRDDHLDDHSWIYACDGAHSSWRKQYFSTHKEDEYDLVLDIQHSPHSPHQIQFLKHHLKQTFPSYMTKMISLSETRSHIYHGWPNSVRPNF